MRKLVACLVALVATAVSNAAPIINSPTGLSNPQNVITFNELGNLQNQTITNQYSSFGATFSGGFFWDNATLGQAGSTGFSGGDLVNFSGTGLIQFTSLVNQAAFAIVDQNGNFTIEALLAGNVVESFNLNVAFNPGNGFVGFSGVNFDSIRIVPNNGAAYTIDTLQFSTPEPLSLVVFGGLLAGGGWLARRRMKASVA